MLVNKPNILSLKNGKDASQYIGNYNLHMYAWLPCNQFISRQSNQLLTMENVHLRFAYPIIIPSYAIRSYYICHISSHGPKYIGPEESENIISYSLRMH